MSIELMSRVWKHAPVSGGSLLVLLALADFADDKGWAWPSVNTLAKRARDWGADKSSMCFTTWRNRG